MSSLFDQALVRRAWDRIVVPAGGMTEVRILQGKLAGSWRTEKVLSGYFDNPEALLAALEGVEAAKGVYFIPNPVNPALMARAANRLRVGIETTTDHDILSRKWLLVDLDPTRPAGIGSSDAEKAVAKAVAAAIRSDLSGLGWAEPLVGDSGNGYHLLYRVDMPNDDESAVMVAQVLAALDARYSTDAVKVDLTVKNASRIWKLYGTVAAKGDDTPERPWRLSRCQAAGGDVVVTAGQLAQVAAWAPAPQPAGAGKSATATTSPNALKGAAKRSGTGRYGVEDALALVSQVSGSTVRKVTKSSGYTVHALDRCVCDRAADGCAITESDGGGGLGLKCQHGTCQHGGGKRPGDAWREFRAANDSSYKPGGNSDDRVSSKALDPEQMDEINSEYAYLRNEGVVLRLRDGERLKPDAFARISIESKYWLDPVNGELRNDFDKVVFDPTEQATFLRDGLRVLNMFDASQLAAPADPASAVGGQQALADLYAVLRNLCRDANGDYDDADVDHLASWVAYAVQHPERRQSACVMVGDTGTGKGTLQTILRGLFGSYVAFPSKNTLEDGNNGWVEQALVVCCDEMSAANMRDRAATADRLLSLITEPELMIVDKWVKSHKAANHSKWLLFSNQNVPVLIRSNDRRYSIFKSFTKLDPAVGKRVSEAYERRDAAYFGAMWRVLSDFDLSAYEPWVARTNAHKQEIIADSADSVEEFWQTIRADFPAIGAVSLNALYALYAAIDPSAAAKVDKRVLSRARPAGFRTEKWGKDKSTYIVRGADGLGDLGRGRGEKWIAGKRPSGAWEEQDASGTSGK